MSTATEHRDPVLAAHEFFRKGEANAEGWSMLIAKGRGWESAYRDRWRHDKVVRSTHGVNCTGSCSWNVYVKDGLITWESQAVDYPRTDPDRPDHEPRGCPRGASFSWYTYSPVRLKYPYVRGSLLERWRAARATRSRPGGGVRARSPPTAATAASAAAAGSCAAAGRRRRELIAAATVHAIREHGPDRVGGFTPIPAMSPVSFAAGTRFLSLIGGHTTTFYDWYADLPPASPQMFGDQTDVPESADWWDASYLIVWGTNLPITRTPGRALHDRGALPRPEGRRRLARLLRPREVRRRLAARAAGHRRRAGDGDGPRDAQGVLGRPAGRRASRTTRKRFTDLPLLVALEERDGVHVPGRFLMAADLGERERARRLEAGRCSTPRPARRRCPTASVGFRYGEEGKGRWNLRLGDLDPVLTLHGRHEEAVEVALPRFDVGDGPGGAVMRRGVPAIRVGGRLVTTVLDLMLATYGVARDGLPGEWPADYDDAARAVHAGVAGGDHRRRPPAGGQGRARVRAQRRGQRRALDDLHGRRAPTTGSTPTRRTARSSRCCCCAAASASTAAAGRTTSARRRSARSRAGSSSRSRSTGAARRARRRARPSTTRTPSSGATTGCGPSSSRRRSAPALFAGMTAIDAHAKAVRMGWMPSFPQFDRNPLELADEAAAAGVDPAEHVVSELKAGRLHFAVEDPSAPDELPARVLRLALEPARLLGQGPGVLPAPPARRRRTTGRWPSRCREGERPAEVRWREEIPRGKLDLLVNVDFRMTTTGLYSDVVLPAATWYEKYDLSMTDMHPFVHSFNQAVPPPWEARTDWDTFGAIARAFSRAGRRAPRRAPRHRRRRRCCTTRPGEIAQPRGEVRDWRAGECEPVPGPHDAER